MAISSPSISIIFFLLFLRSIPLSFSTSESDFTHNFIIHISNSHKPSLFSSPYHWYSSIVEPLLPSPHPTKLLYIYQRAINGFSARITAEQAYRLREIPGILSVIPDQARQIHTTRTPHFLGLSDEIGLWQNSNYGDGVIIGVLYTGIWPVSALFPRAGRGVVASIASDSGTEPDSSLELRDWRRLKRNYG